jgi:hypothetical protein
MTAHRSSINFTPNCAPSLYLASQQPHAYQFYPLLASCPLSRNSTLASRSSMLAKLQLATHLASQQLRE